MCNGPEDTESNIIKCIRKNYCKVHTANMLIDWLYYEGLSENTDKMIRCLRDVIEEIDGKE